MNDTPSVHDIASTWRCLPVCLKRRQSVVRTNSCRYCPLLSMTIESTLDVMVLTPGMHQQTSAAAGEEVQQQFRRLDRILAAGGLSQAAHRRSF